MSQDQASPGRRRNAPEPSLSETDLQLIDLLREDARRSISTLAALIGTSRPAIRRRIDEEPGVRLPRLRCTSGQRQNTAEHDRRFQPPHPCGFPSFCSSSQSISGAKYSTIAVPLI